MFTLVSPALAHGMMAAYLEITESSEGVVVGTWKLPVPSRDVMPEIEGCRRIDQASENDEGQKSNFVYQISFRCGGALAGRQLQIKGLGVTVTEAVVRVAFASGATASHVLGKHEPSWSIPQTQRWSSVFARYAALGVEHILTGADHLLFVLGLVLLIGVDKRREIAWTATFFTLAHSLTLSATALGLVRVSSAAAEATIAATLVLLAQDIGRKEATKRPRVTAFVFGLVHGFGFAGALGEIGLPKGAIAPALLAFNVGVELGQLAFVVLVVLVFGIVKKLANKSERPALVLGSVGTYAIGSLGIFWMLQRWSLLLSQRFHS